MPRLIRDSAPHINTVVIIGCIWILIACFLLGVDSANPPIDEHIADSAYTETEDVTAVRDQRYKTICTVSCVLEFRAP